MSPIQMELITLTYDIETMERLPYLLTKIGGCLCTIQCQEFEQKNVILFSGLYTNGVSKSQVYKMEWQYIRQKIMQPMSLCNLEKPWPKH